MVQPSRLALLVAVAGVLVAAVSLAPMQLPQHRRNNYQHQFDLVLPVDHAANAFKFADADADGTARSERSTNLSHITGTARKIQMFMMNKYLQILPDGSINGTEDFGSDFTIFQRTSVNNGQLKIQGVATCLFLCMDRCGLLYGSREFTEECVFSEKIVENHYNTYSSARYSAKDRTLFLALDRKGKSRKLLLSGAKKPGTRSSNMQVLTRTVAVERVENLVRRILLAKDEANPVRHHGYGRICAQIVGYEVAGNADGARDKFRCQKRRKRKKSSGAASRRCEGDEEGDCELDAEDEGVETDDRPRVECDGDEEQCQKKAVVTTPRVRNNKNNRCKDTALGCRKKERGEQHRNRNHGKCDHGEVGCKRRDEERGRNRNDKCGEGGDCQRKEVDVQPAKDVLPMNRRRCLRDEEDEQCKKRLQESRRRRRARIHEKSRGGGRHENVMRKKLTSGKNNKKFVGDGEISKDLDSGRRLSEQLEIATNLNTPADVVTEATADLSGVAQNANLSQPSPPSPSPGSDQRAANTADIPSDNQRGILDEAPEDSGETVDVGTPSTPYANASTPSPPAPAHSAAPEAEATESETHVPVTGEPAFVDYFYDDVVDKKK